MSISNKPFPKSSTPYEPGKDVPKTGYVDQQGQPTMENVATPRNTQTDLFTKPDPVTGGATTPAGKKLQPPGAPNQGRDGMRPDPMPNPHIPQSTEVKLPDGTPPLPEADPLAEKRATEIASELEDEPHPEHVAGKVAVKLYEAKTAAELEAGRKAVESPPHRRK